MLVLLGSFHLPVNGGVAGADLRLSCFCIPLKMLRLAGTRVLDVTYSRVSAYAFTPLTLVRIEDRIIRLLSLLLWQRIARLEELPVVRTHALATKHRHAVLDVCRRIMVVRRNRNGVLTFPPAEIVVTVSASADTDTAD
jgi:hypothetical protein